MYDDHQHFINSDKTKKLRCQKYIDNMDEIFSQQSLDVVTQEIPSTSNSGVMATASVKNVPPQRTSSFVSVVSSITNTTEPTAMYGRNDRATTTPVYHIQDSDDDADSDEDEFGEIPNPTDRLKQTLALENKTGEVDIFGFGSGPSVGAAEEMPRDHIFHILYLAASVGDLDEVS
jgi:hypothetical protein